MIIIFQYFENCGPNGELLDKILTQKLALFPQLLGGQRVQTLLKFYIYKMSINSISVSFVSTQPLKHSRNRSTLNTFEYRVYDKPHFCVVACLIEYLSRRSNCAEHKKPNKPASPDSIRRCIKGLFTDAKICDFTPHICHPDKGCWKNANTFYRFYHSDILYRANDADFQKIIEV